MSLFQTVLCAEEYQTMIMSFLDARTIVSSYSLVSKQCNHMANKAILLVVNINSLFEWSSITEKSPHYIKKILTMNIDFSRMSYGETPSKKTSNFLKPLIEGSFISALLGTERLVSVFLNNVHCGKEVLRNLFSIKSLRHISIVDSVPGEGEDSFHGLEYIVECEKLESLTMQKCLLKDIDIINISKQKTIRQIDFMESVIESESNWALPLVGMSHLKCITLESVEFKKSERGWGEALSNIPLLNYINTSRTVIDSREMKSIFKSRDIQVVRADDCHIIGELSFHNGSNIEYLSIKGQNGLLESMSIIAFIPNIRQLFIPRCGVNDDSCRGLSRLKNLSQLDVSHNTITENGVEQLCQLVCLTDLNISSNSIGPKGAYYISMMGLLKNLDISCNDIGSKGCEDVAMIKQLVELNLSYNGIKTCGLAKIPRMERLKVLKIESGDITDIGIKYICRLKRLEELKLAHNNIQDTGAFYISLMKHLTRLDISSNLISDKGMDHISRMGRLKFLALMHNNFTNAEKYTSRTNCLLNLHPQL